MMISILWTPYFLRLVRGPQHWSLGYPCLEQTPMATDEDSYSAWHQWPFCRGPRPADSLYPIGDDTPSMADEAGISFPLPGTLQLGYHSQHRHP